MVSLAPDKTVEVSVNLGDFEKILKLLNGIGLTMDVVKATDVGYKWDNLAIEIVKELIGKEKPAKKLQKELNDKMKKFEKK